MIDSDQPLKWQIIIAFISVYIFWGSTYLFIYYAIQSIPPLIMAGLRFMIVGCALYVYARFFKKEKFTSDLWTFGFITGILLFLIGNGAVVLAQKNLPSGLVSIMAGTVPFWILALDHRSGQARFRNGYTWIGLLFGFGGLLILFWDKLHVKEQKPGVVFSFVIMMIGAVSWTVGTLYSKYTKIHASTDAKVSVQTLSSGTLFVILAFLTGDWGTFQFDQVSTISWISLGYLIIFGSLIGYYSFLWLLSHVSAHAVGTHAFVNPLVAVLLGTLFAGEKFDMKEIWALIFIIGGLVAIFLGKRK